MRGFLLGGVLVVAGCGDVDPIGPPESSGESWSTSGTSAPDTTSDTDGTTGDGLETSSTAAGSSSSGSTSSAETTGAGSSGSNGCPEGESGCPCQPDNGCAGGLTCASDICVPDLPCAPEQAGTETCQCTPEGGCDKGLVCASDLCVDAS